MSSNSLRPTDKLGISRLKSSHFQVQEGIMGCNAESVLSEFLSQVMIGQRYNIRVVLHLPVSVPVQLN